MLNLAYNAMTQEHIWEEMKRYVGFTAEDEARLGELGPFVAPHRKAIADDFYERVRDFPLAVAVFSGPKQVERLKGTMQIWIEGLFTGPWDVAYFERRARIGRRHVEIELSQHYMFTAMDVIRQHLNRIISEAAPDLAWAHPRLDSLNKLLDLELGVMLHTYREDYLQKMQRVERLSILGQVAGSIGHELRNPLGVIESSAYLLKRRGGDNPLVARHAAKIDEQVALANRIITNLLDLVRGRSSTCIPMAAQVVVQQAVEQVEETIGGNIEKQLPSEPILVMLDLDQTRQILVNLLTNAIQSSGNEGRVRIRLVAEPTQARFLVEDDGPGIDPEVAHRLFEPLVTTRTHGVGLGLPLCRKLAEAQGGTVGVVQGELSGAAFELVLSRAPDA